MVRDLRLATWGFRELSVREIRELSVREIRELSVREIRELERLEN